MFLYKNFIIAVLMVTTVPTGLLPFAFLDSRREAASLRRRPASIVSQRQRDAADREAWVIAAIWVACATASVLLWRLAERAAKVDLYEMSAPAWRLTFFLSLATGASLGLWIYLTGG